MPKSSTPWFPLKVGTTMVYTGVKDRDKALDLVLGPGKDGKPIRFRVTLDGQAPGGDAGVDVKADGSGMVSEQRLYQLVRQKGTVRDRTFTIEFLDPGVEAFSFTFG